MLLNWRLPSVRTPDTELRRIEAEREAQLAALERSREQVTNLRAKLNTARRNAGVREADVRRASEQVALREAQLQEARETADVRKQELAAARVQTAAVEAEVATARAEARKLETAFNDARRNPDAALEAALTAFHNRADGILDTVSQQ